MNTFVDAPVVYSRVYNIYKTIMFIVIMVIVYSVLYCIHIAGLVNTGVYTSARPLQKGFVLGVGIVDAIALPTLH